MISYKNKRNPMKSRAAWGVQETRSPDPQTKALIDSKLNEDLPKTHCASIKLKEI